MNYQPPSFRQPEQFNLPQSIDALFNQYQQGRLTANAESRQRVQDIGAYGFDPTQVTPEQWNRNLNSPPPVAPQPGSPLAQDMQQGTAPGGVPDPHDAAIQNFLALRRQQMQLGALQAQAGLAKAQGDAREANLKPNLMGVPGLPGQVIPTGAGNAGGVLAETAQRYGQGLVPDPYDAVGRDPLLRLGLQNQFNKQGINQVGVENQLTAQKSASEVRGKQGQTIGAMAGSLEDMLARAEPLITKLSSSKFKLLNSAFIEGKHQVNDPDVSELLPLLNSGAGFYATLLNNGNAPDVETNKIAREKMAAGLDPRAFAGMKRSVVAEGRSRFQRISGAGYNQKVDLGNEGSIKPGDHSALLNKYGLP